MQFTTRTPLRPTYARPYVETYFIADYMRKKYANPGYKAPARVSPIQYATRRKPRRVPGFPMVPYRPPSTRRMPRRKRTYQVARAVSGGSTSTRLVFGNSRPPKAYAILYKQNQEYMYEYLTSRRETSAFGKQNVHAILYNDQASVDQLFATIPQLAASPTLYNTGKFIFQDMTSKMTFTNQDLATAYVTIYSIVPRFHIPPGFSTINAWDIGLQNQQLVPGANDDYRDAYAKPYASQEFCLYYKIDKVTTFELQQGQSHCHETTWHINKAIHGQISANFNAMRDIAKYNMVVTSGTPINDLTDKLSVSTSSCAIDIVERITKTYTYAANQRTIRTYENSLSTISTAEIASIGAGIVVAEDEA